MESKVLHHQDIRVQSEEFVEIYLKRTNVGFLELTTSVCPPRITSVSGCGSPYKVNGVSHKPKLRR